MPLGRFVGSTSGTRRDFVHDAPGQCSPILRNGEEQWFVMTQ